MLLLLVTQSAQAGWFNKMPRSTLVVDGVERSFYLHEPSVQGDQQLPVFLFLHGGGRSGGDKLAKMTGLNDIADREGFIAVYPNGIDGQWNDGRGAVVRDIDVAVADDVAYLAALIDHLVDRGDIDPDRIYIAGVSNGGMMTLRLGCELSRKITAIAAVIANIPLNIFATCQPEKKLPVLIMNGTEDPLVPWHGGELTFFRKKAGLLVSTDETLDFWVNHNQCTNEPATKYLPDLYEKDHSTVQTISYEHCADGTSVVLYKIINGGHQIPGPDAGNLRRILGNKNRDINAPEVIWSFFAR